MICLYLKIAEKFVRLNPLNGFQIVDTTLIRMIKFKILAQLAVDHFPYPTESSFIFLHQFTTFTYYVIDRFVVSCLVLLRGYLSLWYCFVLLFKEDQFLC